MIDSSDEFVVISRKGEENIIAPMQRIAGKTVSEVKKEFLSEDSYLFYSTPLYSERLQEDCVLQDKICSKMQQHIKPSKYLLPQYYFSAISSNDFDFSINFFLDSQSDIMFPPFSVFFKRSDFLNCLQIFEYVSSKLTGDHSKTVFLRDNNEIDINENSDDFFESAKIQPVALKTEFSDGALKRFVHRKNILKEILETEVYYINELSVLVNYWAPGVKGMKCLSDEEIDTIFGDLPKILKCHQNFKDNLENRGIEYASTVADVFIKFSDEFKVAKRFISTYSSITVIINEKIMKDKTYSAQLHDLALKNPFDEEREITSYLITPVQRMPRYILFLRELVKYSPPEHQDTLLLPLASKSIENVTFEIDKASAAANKVSQIMSKFTKPFFIIKGGRTLVRQEQVTITKPTCSSGVIYLFNDSVLLATVDNSLDNANETPLFIKYINLFHYFPSYSSINFSFRISHHEKRTFGHNRIHYSVYFPNENVCKSFLNDLENQKKEPDSDSIVWKNLYLPNDLKSSNLTEGTYFQGLSYFFGGESREVPNCQLVSVKGQNLVKKESVLVASRFGHSFDSNENSLIVFGGKNSNDFLNDTWIFKNFENINNSITNSYAVNNNFINNNGNKWEKINAQSPPTKRSFHASCCHNNKLVIFGGLTYKKKCLDDLNYLDLESKKWFILEHTGGPSPRYMCSGCLCNDDQFIIVGGRNEKTIFNDVFALDLSKMKWREIKTDLSCPFSPRFGCKMVSFPDCVLTIGGTSTEAEDGAQPTAIDITTGKIYNFEEYGNHPNSLTGFGFCQTRCEDGTETDAEKVDKKNYFEFIAFGGAEAGTKTARNSGFIVMVPRNIKQIISEGKTRIKNTKSAEDLVDFSKQEEMFAYATSPMNRPPLIAEKSGDKEIDSALNKDLIKKIDQINDEIIDNQNSENSEIEDGKIFDVIKDDAKGQNMSSSSEVEIIQNKEIEKEEKDQLSDEMNIIKEIKEANESDDHQNVSELEVEDQTKESIIKENKDKTELIINEKVDNLLHEEEAQKFDHNQSTYNLQSSDNESSVNSAQVRNSKTTEKPPIKGQKLSRASISSNKNPSMQQQKPISNQNRQQKSRQNQKPSQAQNQKPSQAQNQKPSQSQNQNQNQNRTQRKVQNQTQSKVQNQTQSKVQNQTQSKVQNQAQNKVQDQNQGKNKKQNQSQNNDSSKSFIESLRYKRKQINSNLCPKPPLRRTPIFEPPKVTNADLLFCRHLGFDISQQKLFNQKLIIRRLKKAVQLDGGQSNKKRSFASVKQITKIIYFSKIDEEKKEIKFNIIDTTKALDLLTKRINFLTNSSHTELFLCSLEFPNDLLVSFANGKYVL